MRAEMRNYQMVDLMKYVGALMVMCIHSAPLIPHDFTNFVINQILCRIAVPFFIISSAYFIRQRSQSDSLYLKRYFTGSIKTYLMWSAIFLPLGLTWIQQNTDLSPNMLPLALLFGLFRVGTYYHLWYIPALIFGVYCVDRLKRRFSYRTIFVSALIFYIFGSLETYFGVLPESSFKLYFAQLIAIIYTTRSGLFYSLIFVVMGFYTFDKRDSIKRIANSALYLSIVFGGLLLIEGVFLYRHERMDMNFLLMLVPFSFTFFITLLSAAHVPKVNCHQLRHLSKYYFFIHPISILLVNEAMKYLGSPQPWFGMVSFIVVLSVTHAFTLGILFVEKHWKTILQFTSVIVSGALAALFFINLLATLTTQTLVLKLASLTKLVFTSILFFYIVVHSTYQSLD